VTFTTIPTDLTDVAFHMGFGTVPSFLPHSQPGHLTRSSV